MKSLEAGGSSDQGFRVRVHLKLDSCLGTVVVRCLLNRKATVVISCEEKRFLLRIHEV